MSEYLSEQEQIEQIKGWWNDNGSFVVTGLLIGIAVLAGWNYWKSYTAKRAQAASALYTQLLGSVDAGDTAKAEALVEELSEKYKATPYYGQSGLAIAKLYVSEGSLDKAAAALGRTASEGGETLAHVARIRLARVQIDQGQAQEAVALLTNAEAGAFEPLYYDVLGDAYAAAGDKESARDAYQKALDDPNQLADRAYIQVKLDALGLGRDTQ